MTFKFQGYYFKKSYIYDALLNVDILAKFLTVKNPTSSIKSGSIYSVIYIYISFIFKTITDI